MIFWEVKGCVEEWLGFRRAFVGVDGGGNGLVIESVNALLLHPTRLILFPTLRILILSLSLSLFVFGFWENVEKHEFFFFYKFF